MAFATEVYVFDRATPALVDLEGLLKPSTIARAAGRSGADFTMLWFVKLDEARANKLGGERTHFYSQAAKTTNFTSDDSGATISVNQVGLRQRIEGGTIVPRNGGKYLTIPARAEAYGKRASEFNNLKVLWGASGPVALVEADATRLQGSRKKGFSSAGETGGAVYFWLVPKVVQQPDPTILGTEFKDGLRNAVLVALRQAVDLSKARASGGAK